MVGGLIECREVGFTSRRHAFAVVLTCAAAVTFGVLTYGALAADGFAGKSPGADARGSSKLASTALLAPARSVRTSLSLPRVLSDADAARYREIFKLQRRRAWKAADAEVNQLEDRLLVGHVLFERYMHPTGYRSSYPELHHWLARYADHPGAKRVYRLALRRHLKGWKWPRKPDAVSKPTRETRGVDRRAGAESAAKYASGKPRGRAQRKMARRLRASIARNLRRGRVTAAANLLRQKKTRGAFSARELDRARAKVASVYYYLGMDAKALKLAERVARPAENAPHADWIAGLAAWRLKKWARARTHFERLARSTTASAWNVAAGAYWAARTNMVLGRGKDRERMLEIAARHPRTFYGLLGARLLATDNLFSWREPRLTAEHVARLREIPAVRRAIALIRVDRLDLAQREIRQVWRSASRALGPALLALATRLQMPAIQMRLGEALLDPRSPYYDAATYPLPPWRPGEGFAVDRALLYAFMRKESAFSSHAKSSAGARGLMQLMPRTASYVAKDVSLHGGNKEKLFWPEFNLKLGQDYLNYLMRNRRVRGNLLFLAAAYNAGPGKLSKWLKRVKYGNDPLLFLESVPSSETRQFIERVLTNFWIYRHRLNQDVPSLDAIANGNWPYYVSLDMRPITVANNAKR